MSCGCGTSLFRLLDPIVGWDLALAADSAKGLTGLDDMDGITLAELDPGAVSGGDIDPYLTPPWLAKGCGPCEWYLVTRTSRLLRLGDCACDWQPVWSERCNPLPEARIAAVAVQGHRIAVADDDGITLFESSGDYVAARIGIGKVSALTFAPNGTVIVAQEGRDRLQRFDPSGAPLAPFSAALLKETTIARMGVGPLGTVWLATPAQHEGTYHLWSARSGEDAFTAASLTSLAEAFARTGLEGATEQGFCIERQAESAGHCCWSRDGEPADPKSPGSGQGPRYVARGQLLTAPIDSGIPRCTWHRVRIYADIPPGATLEVAVASAETLSGKAQGDNQDPWTGFPAGVPHPLDWQQVSADTDFLIRQPAGRYIYVRVRLECPDGAATPRLRRIRIDFPRVTSLDLLPAIYRQDAESEDFTARFLALFDASIADLDDAIERAPALLDVGGVPDDVLPWLGRLLSLTIDPAWEPERRRAILRALPELYRRRGTLAGIKLAMKLVFDAEPAIEELALTRNWAAFDKRARLGSARLFGRKRARAQLGRSALGSTVIKSYGDPAADPLEALAYRIQVLMPPASAGKPIQSIRVQALLDSQKPAHTVTVLRVGGAGFVLGARSAIGIDTAFTPAPAPVLGRSGNVRLNSFTVLRRGRPCSGRGGTAFANGLRPLME
jgi:phage tail-like protein